MSKDKIVLWCGANANQKALAAKINKQFSLAAIVIDEKKGSVKKRSLFDVLKLFIDRLRFHEIYAAWSDLQSYYDSQFEKWPDVPTLRVTSINSNDVVQFTKSYSPGLIVVSGTSMIKEAILQTPVEKGIINLHTGLSPYIKGGPNCTNWCIAKNEWQLIGNTIMWINEGIDTGNIITTEQVDVFQCSSLLDAQKKVMDHAHQLYLRAIQYLLSAQPPYNSIVQQTLGKGKLYLTKMWTTKMKKALLKNWKLKKNSGEAILPVTVALPEISE